MKAREQLLTTWKSIQGPKPPWEVFKRMIAGKNSTVQQALLLWRKQIPDELWFSRD